MTEQENSHITDIERKGKHEKEKPELEKKDGSLSREKERDREIRREIFSVFPATLRRGLRLRETGMVVSDCERSHVHPCNNYRDGLVSLDSGLDVSFLSMKMNGYMNSVVPLPVSDSFITHTHTRI